VPTARIPLQTRSKRTRDALLAAGAREFSERGYASATAKSIAARAGAATGSFYQYFPDKDALLRELARARQAGIAAEVMSVLAPSTSDVPEESSQSLLPLVEDRIARLVRVVLLAHREDPGLHAVLTERRHADSELDTLTGEGEEALCNAVAAMLERWRYSGDRRATAFVLVGMVEGAVHAHVLGKAIVSDARLVSALVGAVLNVIAGGRSVSADAPSKSKSKSQSKSNPQPSFLR
jgi:AcrR family transcriptional regulator